MVLTKKIILVFGKQTVFKLKVLNTFGLNSFWYPFPLKKVSAWSLIWPSKKKYFQDIVFVLRLPPLSWEISPSITWEFIWHPCCLSLISILPSTPRWEYVWPNRSQGTNWTHFRRRYTKLTAYHKFAAFIILGQIEQKQSSVYNKMAVKITLT